MATLSRGTVLVIEKNPSQPAEWEKWAQGIGFNTCLFADPEQTSSHFAGLRPDIAVLGRSLKHEARLKSLHRLKVYDPALPAFVIDDVLKEEAYLNYPFEAVYHIGPEQDLEEEILHNLDNFLPAKKETAPHQDYPIIGQGEAVKKIRKQILNLAVRDITVLVTGESGTGKELIARAIHYYSKRSSQPMVKIQCGSMPDDLFESEVLGFQRGAFTGAETDKPGRLEIADGGTLFIDDVGDLTPYLQSKFLNIFEDKEFFRLGDILDKPIDARIIAATNADLREEMNKGSFRKDLFYRLNIANITAPPLRHRTEDIPLLTDYFLNKYGYELKRDIPPFPSKLMESFIAYRWPGNIRELENLIRRIMVVGDTEFAYSELERKNAAEKEDREKPSSHERAHTALSEDHIRNAFRHNNFSLKATTRGLISEVEYREILSALKKTNWNRKKAAKLLQISYKTILNRIDQFDLKP